MAESMICAPVGRMGRRPRGFSAKSISLPAELWAMVEAFRQEQHLSSTAEAIRVLLFRLFEQVDRERQHSPRPLHPDE
jgi:hypothetical protein